uniref:Uncharacterized protein n=1 Tax=Hucho hucho TaxID=62062 RepID=A0A4W5K239_9TELE
NVTLCFVSDQSGRRNVDLDQASSHPKRGLLHSSPDSLADSWFRVKHSREQLYGSPLYQSYEESDPDLSRSLGVHALIENIVSFISGDAGNTPAFKEPEESMSTSPQGTILAMVQQQNRAEVRTILVIDQQQNRAEVRTILVIDQQQNRAEVRTILVIDQQQNRAEVRTILVIDQQQNRAEVRTILVIDQQQNR